MNESLSELTHKNFSPSVEKSSETLYITNEPLNGSSSSYKSAKSDLSTKSNSSQKKLKTYGETDIELTRPILDDDNNDIYIDNYHPPCWQVFRFLRWLKCIG